MTKGYKGFNKGLLCRGKQYTENTVFKENTAEICNSGMHFCKNPFDVLEYYGFVDSNAELNEFAEVEALDECKTDDNKKYCTKELKIGAKLGIAGLVKAFVDFTLSKIDFKSATELNTGNRSAATNTGYCSAATNTGNRSAATNTGYCSAATNTGDYSAATNTGDYSAASVDGVGSVAITIGYASRAKAKKGSAIVVCERDTNGKLIAIKAAIIDGVILKEDTYYSLKDGEFVEWGG